MKLRNKKTGEYGRFMMCHDDDKYPFYIEATAESLFYYHNFGEMLEAGWEVDITPQEPLIKDEKIRKAIIAFAELQDSKTISFEKTYRDISVIARADNGYAMMWLCDKSGLENIEYRKHYTITELCGEEGE